MKKSKLLVPILGVASAAAVAAPLIALTSCNNAEKVEMQLTTTASKNSWTSKSTINASANKSYSITLPQSAGSFGYLVIQVINDDTYCKIKTDATINGKAVKFEYNKAGGYQYHIVAKERFTQDLTITFTTSESLKTAKIYAEFNA